MEVFWRRRTTYSAYNIECFLGGGSDRLGPRDGEAERADADRTQAVDHGAVMAAAASGQRWYSCNSYAIILLFMVLDNF